MVFIPHDPEVWFATSELQFKARRIAHEMIQFTYALDSLPANVIAWVSNVVLNT